jgi:hypothetical protein
MHASDNSPKKQASSGTKWYILTASVLILLLSFNSGCQTPEIIPTPTPTRTPVIPTLTPTLTPTITPSPTPTQTPTSTPTLPANLVLPPGAQPITDWLPLPADLYFLHNGRINIWLAEGMHLEIPLLSEDNSASVHSYRVAQDGRYIAYITTTGKLYKLDRATFEHTFIPTSGYLIEANTAQFEMTDDGKFIYYVAWGTQPSTISSPRSPSPSGTILGVNTQQPQNLQTVIGFCQGIGDVPCIVLTLSPTEDRIGYIDGQGIWLATTETQSTHLLTPHSGTAIYTHLTWSPDGRWLLINSDNHEFLLFDTQRGDSLAYPLILCEIPCDVSWSWASNNLWFIIKDASQACLVEVSPEKILNNQTEFENRICQLDTWELLPSTIQAFRDNRVAFLNQGCEKPCVGVTSGLYVRNEDNTLIPIALSDQVDGTVTWNSDGSAFLFVSSKDAVRQIGLLNSQSFWDVTGILRDGSAFQWGESLINQ